MYSPVGRGEKIAFIAISAVTGLILLALGIFYVLNPRPVIGDALVNTPIGTPEEIPPIGYSPFYVKPVTIMFVSVIVFSYCLFCLASQHLNNIPRPGRSVLLIFSVLSIGVCVYEVFFNFALWESLIASHGNPDLIVNQYPSSSVKINLVFATKSFVALLFVSLFGFLTLKHSLDIESPS